MRGAGKIDWLLISASLNGFIGVAAGAFAAHGLRGALSERMLAAFHTGADYQLLHAAVLLGLAALARSRASRAVSVSGWCLTLGAALFAGSLYVLALTGASMIAFVTPLGGVFLLAGWIALAVAAFSRAP